MARIMEHEPVVALSGKISAKSYLKLAENTPAINKPLIPGCE